MTKKPALRSSGDPEVSVLMSCHNAERWLQASVESVLAQSFRAFELVIIDDGSTDSTWNLIESLHARDSRIVPIRKANTGLTDSLNVGLAHVRGFWTARLDSDDISEIDRLNEQIVFMRRHPDVALVGSAVIEIDEVGHPTWKRKYPSSHNDLLANLRRMRRFFPHSSAFFRTHLVRELGGYNRLFRKSQDHDLWLRIAERAPISCLGRHLVRVRKHPSQISNSSTGISQLAYGVAATACHFMRNHGAFDPSNQPDPTLWDEYISWVEARISELGLLKASRDWTAARSDYVTSQNKAIAGFRLARHLLASGYAGVFIKQRLQGSALPRQLADEWLSRATTANRSG